MPKQFHNSCCCNQTDSQGQSPRSTHMKETRGHQISAQIKIRQLFLPPPHSLHCPSVHTTAPVTHLDVLSTLKQHQLKGRTNQSVMGEHIGITIQRSSEDA